MQTIRKKNALGPGKETFLILSAETGLVMLACNDWCVADGSTLGVMSKLHDVPCEIQEAASKENIS